MNETLEEVTREFHEIVCWVCARETINFTAESTFEADLGMDSLDLIDLFQEIEIQFGIRIPSADADTLKTVGQAITYIMEHAPE